MALKKLFILTLLGVFVFSSLPVGAQGTVEDQVFAVVGQNIGMLPMPTKGEIDRGLDDSYPLTIGYRKVGLDLNATSGVPQCDSRVMGDEELIIGWFGFRIVVTVAGRSYEFRTDASGRNIIRCSGGRQVDLNFGAPASRGATRSGWDITDQAMTHLTNYLGLSPAITRAAVDAAAEARRNREENDYPHRVSYRWDSAVFSNSALNCPGRGQSFNTGPAAGYRVSLSVNGRNYQYRSSLDGAVLILCLGGRADPSSLGVTIPESS